MKKNIYVMKLKNLQNQINAMLQEATLSDVVDEEYLLFCQSTGVSAEEVAKASEVVKSNIETAAKAAGNASDVADKVEKVMPKEGKFSAVKKSIVDFGQKHAKVLKGSAIGLAAIVTVMGGWMYRAASAMKKVVRATDKAINAENYQSMSKAISSLKKLSSNDLWNRIMITGEARSKAASNIEAFKKSYVGIGIAMVMVSVILLILMASSAKSMINDLMEAAKTFSFESIMRVLGKALIFGALILPALVGAAFIYLGTKGFPEEGIAAQFVGLLSPVVRVSNMLVKSVLDSGSSAVSKSAYVKSLRSVKKLDYLAF